uniref:Uncharacterized protein n=1 Tax=Panagrolaimus sp. PS1159 TaxID=55785 RepID=A0AC35GP91_9BILA
MKVVLFLLSFCCIFVLTKAAKCYVNEMSAQGDNKFTNCTVCGYHYQICEENMGKAERLCLTEPAIKYEDENGSHTLDKIGECIFFTKGNCKHNMYLCQEDECNSKCGTSSDPTMPPRSLSSSTLIPSVTPLTISSTPPTPPTTEFTTSAIENGGSLAANLLSVFGFLSISFFILC